MFSFVSFALFVVNFQESQIPKWKNLKPQRTEEHEDEGVRQALVRDGFRRSSIRVYPVIRAIRGSEFVWLRQLAALGSPRTSS